MSERTRGELQFEKYLNLANIAFEFEAAHPNKRKRPDFTIAWNNQRIIFDVKDFNTGMPSLGLSGMQPYDSIRHKIDAGKKKFSEFKDSVCALVLFNDSSLVEIENPRAILGAMYGDVGFTFNPRMDASQPKPELRQGFLNRGKMVNRAKSVAQNRTISAILTLTEIRPHFELVRNLVKSGAGIWDAERQVADTTPDFDMSRALPRIIVWHNAVARLPFPVNLFNGPYDSHFGPKPEDPTLQTVLFRGAELPDSCEF